jgi:hypothetical protein
MPANRNDQPDDRPPPFNLDADPFNADWPKRTWDLDIDNVEELRQFLRDTGTSVEAFKRLPVYVWNVVKPEMAWLKDL